MSSGGWTVADTATLKPKSSKGSPQKQQLQQEPKSPPELQSSVRDSTVHTGAVKRGEHHVRWSDNFRSKSEEDLDKLLDGLTELTETLPDLKETESKSFSTPIRNKSEGEQLYAVPEAKNGSVPKKKHVSPNVNKSEEKIVNVNKQPRPVVLPEDGVPDRPPPPSFDAISGKNGRARSPLSRQDGLDTIDNSITFPSVRQTRQLLQSRDTYSAGGSLYSGSDGGSNNNNSNGNASNQPYHTLQNSKPFSYIRMNGAGGSIPGSRNLSRTSSREALANANVGLESPSLLRKIIGGIEDTDRSDKEPTPEPAFKEKTSPKTRQIPLGQTSNGVQSERFTSTASYTVQDASNPRENPSQNIINPYASDEEASLSWLDRQKKKLLERRETERRRGPKSTEPMMNELKSALPPQTSEHQPKSETTTDGYVSDLASMLYSETSSTRESSPNKMQEQYQRIQQQNASLYNVPVKVDTGYYNKQSQLHQQRQTNNQSQQAASYNVEPTYTSTYNTSNGQYGVPQSYMQYQQQQQQYHQQQQQYYQQYYNQYQSTPNDYYGRQGPTSLSRQRSDTSYDRSRPFISRRLRFDSESESELQVSDLFSRGRSNGLHNSNTSIDSASAYHQVWGSPGSRPITPAFPAASTPSGGHRSGSLQRGVNGLYWSQRAGSPAGSLYQQAGEGSSRRGSVSSEPAEVSPMHVKLVKDYYKFWYKPNISREDAIAMLKHQQPGTFVVRDSNSFPGAFGLALKVSSLPVNPSKSSSDSSSELVRHFLIEPTSKGVKLKGYSNEPVFASLSALVYQHTLTQLALPTKLVLPQHDLSSGHRDSTDSRSSTASQMQQLLAVGAACNVTYLLTLDTDTLTGPAAVKRSVGQLLAAKSASKLPAPLLVHFKVSAQGITLTDTARKRFFRKHFNTNAITFCGLDPDDRRYNIKSDSGPSTSQRIFGFVAKKQTSRSMNQCHIFAEYDPEQPAKAIVNFVNKVMLSGNGARADVV